MVLCMLWDRNDSIGLNFRVFDLNGDRTLLGILEREKVDVFF